MKALLGSAAAIIAVSVNAAEPQPDRAASEASTAAEEGNEIIVEAQRLPEELKNTTLVMVRGRDNRVMFKIRADGTFASSMNGLPSDFGKWRVEQDNVCFDGRMRGTFCGPGLLGKRPGDAWVATGYDGMRWEARLIADD